MAKGFDSELKGAIPKWALGMCATMFCVALTVRLIGIDMSTPINVMFAAYAERVKQEGLTGNNDEVVLRLDKLEERAHDSK